MSEAIIIFILIIINGIFSMAENAIVSSNRHRLQYDSEKGDKNATRALDLVNAPSKFLSTVQICITIIGIVSGVFGGITLYKYLHLYLEQFTPIPAYGEKLSYVIVVALITYVSIVVGELIPKRLALLYPESIAKKLSGLMKLLSIVGSPMVWILS